MGGQKLMKYYIYQGQGQSGDLVKIGEVTDKKTFMVSGLQAKTVYRFAVSAYNGLRESPKSDILTITTADIPLSSITLTIEKTALEVGNTTKATMTVVPANQTIGTPTLSSSNIKVATIDSAGNITAVAPGTTDIQAVLGKVSSSILTITVYEALVDVTNLTSSNITANGVTLTWS
jgi:uncharacterized protein YjdB